MITSFLGLDVSKDSHSVAFADSGRDGEVRFLGDISSLSEMILPNWMGPPGSMQAGGLLMGSKRQKPEMIVSKLRQVEVLRGQGMAMSDAIRHIGVSELTFYRWRKKYGDMGADQLKELK